MLNFDNARAVTDKMLVYSRNYVEMVIQKTLDNCIFFDENDPEELRNPLSSGCDALGLIYGVLNGEDKDIFWEIFSPLQPFEVYYNCHGEISISMRRENDENSAIFRLVSECLLENGFTDSKDNKLSPYYTICLKDVPSTN